jgi:hypothetical protein
VTSGDVEGVRVGPGEFAGRRGRRRRGIQAGHDLLEQAQPTHDAVLTAALDKASDLPELAPLVDALAKLALPARSSPRTCSTRSTVALV